MELKTLREHLALAHSESQRMKKINKELLDSMLDVAETPTTVSKHKNSMVSLLEGLGENDFDQTITTTNQSANFTANSTLKAQ